jgi:hypothetical protein
MTIIDRSSAIFSWCMKIRQVGRIQLGRVLGTVSNTKGSYKAWIDLLERSYFMRAEINALTALLIKKGAFTEAEWMKQWEEEASSFFKEVSKDWPEVEFTDYGYTIVDPVALAERSKREGWPP